MNYKLITKNGFTLLELLIGLFVSSIILFFTISFVHTARRSIELMTVKTEQLSTINYILNTISEDLINSRQVEIKENRILLKGKFLNYGYEVKDGNVLRNSKRIMTCELLEIEELSIAQINGDYPNPENGIKLFDISLTFSYNKQNTQTVICRVAQRIAATDKELLTTDKHR